MPKYDLEISPQAEREMNQAFDYYQEKKPGLGVEFLEEVDKSLDLLVKNPLIFRIRFDEVRRVNLNIFPYAIFYEVIDNTIFVNHIIHGGRNPESWGK